jgi:hypothetical protein
LLIIFTKERGIVLNEKLVSYIFFITAIVDFVVAISSFSGNNITVGVTYLLIGIVFIALGLRYRKRYNKK